MARLATPLVLAEISWVLMGIVDTMMVGRLPNGAEAIGASSLGNTLFYVVGVFGSGLLLGLDTLVSQSFGAGKVQDCHHSLLNAIYLMLGVTPVSYAIFDDWGAGRLFGRWRRKTDAAAGSLPQSLPQSMDSPATSA